MLRHEGFVCVVVMISLSLSAALVTYSAGAPSSITSNKVAHRLTWWSWNGNAVLKVLFLGGIRGAPLYSSRENVAIFGDMLPC